MLLRHIVLTASILCSVSVSEARNRPTTPPAVVASHHIARESGGVFLDVAVSPDAVLAVWSKDYRSIYAQRLSRVDLSPLGPPVLAHSQADAAIYGGVHVVYDGEQFVAVWPARSSQQPNADLYRVVINHDGTADTSSRVASNVASPLHDVLWTGTELIVTSHLSIAVLDDDGVLIGQHAPLSLGISSLAAGRNAVHVAWQSHRDPRTCRLGYDCNPPVFVESTTLPLRSSVTPGLTRTWSAFENELLSPAIAATGSSVVIAAQRMAQNDRDEVIAFQAGPETNERSRHDVLLGSGHSPALASFGRRFAFAWISGPLETGKPSALSIRVADATLAQLSRNIELPLGENFQSAYFANASWSRPRIAAVSDTHFVVAFMSGDGASVALISGGAPARPRIVR